MVKRDREEAKASKAMTKPKKQVKQVKQQEEEESAESSEENQESSGSSQESSDAEDEVDEFDVEAASDLDSADNSDDSDQENDDNDSDDEIPKRKKSKNTDDGSESFANAFNSIISSKLKAYNREAPIMSRNKRTLKKLESDKLEAKAKRALNAEKKQLYDKHRNKNLFPSADKSDSVRQTLESEKKLKRTAQRGVVRLFNAILSTQVRATQAVNTEKAGEMKKKELFNEISKEKFLDLVQAAGDE